jgi:23S rRNA (cytidine1920-2'-O)/16S rRNA (cytidine1409-2'-O)-methyltransferase
VLVERGLFESRAKAQAAITAGVVSANGAPIRRASDLVEAGADIVAEAAHPYVSRGGLKLAHALDRFGFDPAGLVCLDVGASTGGFTDVLLRRGAARVHAVDVGRRQMHPSLAQDPRVVAMEATDIRALDPAGLPDGFPLAVVDVSFISLRLVLPAVARLLNPGAALVALVKPQFEAGRERVRKGIVRDEAVHREICEDIAAFAQELGFRIAGVVPSPITGGDGNREFLLGATLDG